MLVTQAGIIEWHNPGSENNSQQSQSHHDSDSEVQRGTGNMPRGPFIALANHIVRKDRNEGRAERASRDDVKNQVWYQKCLQEGIGGAGRTKDVSEHGGTQEPKYAAGDERAC